MRLVKLYVFVSLISLFSHCSPDVTSVTVIRNPVVSFSYNQTSEWTARSYSFADISEVVVYPVDTAQPAQVFSRFTFEATGNDNAGNELKIIIAFDTKDAGLLTGTYLPAYSTLRGLAQVQVYDLTNSDNLSAYNLCDTADAVFTIQKQNPDEHLITGSFAMTLCDTRDANKKISITNGIFKDIQY